MALPNINLIAPSPYWTGQAYPSGTTYTADSQGRVTAPANDVNSLEGMGCIYANNRKASYTFPGAPAIAGATAIAGSTTQTMVAGATITIASQPDVARQLAVVVTPPGSSFTLSAGSVVMTYAANDGTTQVDTLNFGSLLSAAAMTLTTSKGVEHLTSAIISSPVATAPGVGGTVTLSIGTNNFIAVPLDPGFVGFAFTKETKITPTNGTFGLSVPADEAISTLTTSNGMISPTTAPDGTHGFSFAYTYAQP